MSDKFDWLNNIDFQKVNKIGKILKYFRLYSKKTSREVAKEIDIKFYKMSKIELEEYQLTNEKIVKALKFFGVTKEKFESVSYEINHYPFSTVERKLRNSQRQTFSQNLKYLLLKKGYSRKEFSKLINAKIPTIQRWLGGFSVPTKRLWNDAFLKSLNLSIDDIENMKLNTEQLSFLESNKRKSVSRSELTDFGINLHYFRLKKHLTFEQLAEKAGCLPTVIVQWERGINKKTGLKQPPKDLLRKISKALNVTQTKLLAHNKDRNKKFNDLENERKKKMYAVQINLAAKLEVNYWRLSQLADFLGISSAQVASWINGDSYPSEESLKRIYEALDIKERTFFNPENVKKKEKLVNFFRNIKEKA